MPRTHARARRRAVPVTRVLGDDSVMYSSPGRPLPALLPGGARSPIAQLAEQPAVNRQVFGSSPNGGAVPQVTDLVLAGIDLQPHFTPLFFATVGSLATTSTRPAGAALLTLDRL